MSEIDRIRHVSGFGSATLVTQRALAPEHAEAAALAGEKMTRHPLVEHTYESPLRDVTYTIGIAQQDGVALALIEGTDGSRSLHIGSGAHDPLTTLFGREVAERYAGSDDDRLEALGDMAQAHRDALVTREAGYARMALVYGNRLRTPEEIAVQDVHAIEKQHGERQRQQEIIRSVQLDSPSRELGD